MNKLTWDQVGTSETRFFASGGLPAAPAIRGNRAFLGDGRNHGQQVDGSVTGGSWLQSFTINANGTTTTITELDYAEDTARLAVVSSFGVGVTGASRTSGGTGAEQAIGVFGLAVNDDGTTPALAWGGYIEANRTHLTSGQTIGLEINVAQTPAASANGAIGPYGDKGSDWTNVLRVAVGSDGRSTFPSPGVFPRSFAANSGITFANNGGAMHEGIVFDWNAIMREGDADDTAEPPNTGYARAVTMANEQGLSWYSRDPVGAAGTQAEVVRMFSSVTLPNRRWRAVFSDGSFDINESVSPGSSLFRVEWRDDAASFLQVSAGDGTVAPKISALGVATNIPLRLAPKGTGWVEFGAIGNVREYADDTAAAAGGLSIGAIYRTGSVLKVRAA